MKAIKYTSLLVLLLLTVLISNTQVKYIDKGVNIQVKGTSNLHDWAIKSDYGEVDASLAMNAGDKNATILKLNFVVGSGTFKSGHSGMDKNVYKALQAKNYPNIIFELATPVTVPADGNLHQVKTTGKLTIAGVTKQIDLVVSCKWNSVDKNMVVNGAKSLKMTEFNVKPPTALLGTIKTGDEISIDFYVRITK